MERTGCRSTAQNGGNMYKRILLAYDGSEAGQKALLECKELAQWANAELCLVAVMPPASALIGGSLAKLAESLGLSDRQLRRVIRSELGISPIELAQTSRLLLAKRLIAETQLPMTQVALASGFESVRRFNAAFQRVLDATVWPLKQQHEEVKALFEKIVIELREIADFADAE